MRERGRLEAELDRADLLGDAREEHDDRERHQERHAARRVRERRHVRDLQDLADEIGQRERRRPERGHEDDRQREDREQREMDGRIRVEAPRRVGRREAREEVARGDAVVVPCVRRGEPPADPDAMEERHDDEDPRHGRSHERSNVEALDESDQDEGG